MAKDTKTRGMKLELRHDNVDWMVRIDRDLTVTIRPKHAHAARSKSVPVRDIIDWVRGVRDLPIPRAEMEAPKPEPTINPELARLEAKARFQANLKALTASRRATPQPQQTSFA